MPVWVYLFPAAFIIAGAVAEILKKLVPGGNRDNMAKPSSVIGLFLALAGTAEAVALINGMIYDNLGFPSIPVSLVFFGGGWSLFLASRKSLIWDNEKVEGPANSIGPNFKWPTAQMKWSEISSVQQGHWSFHVETADGRRIYWNKHYAGIEHFVHDLKRHRPNLPLPPMLTYQPSSGVVLSRMQK